MEEDFSIIYPEYEYKYGKSSFFQDYNHEYALLFLFKVQSLFTMDIKELVRLRNVRLYSTKNKNNKDEHEAGEKLLNKSQKDFLLNNRKVKYANENINRFIESDNHSVDEQRLEYISTVSDRLLERLKKQGVNIDGSNN